MGLFGRKKKTTVLVGTAVPKTAQDIRAALKQENYKIVGEAKSKAELLALWEKKQPDITLVDDALPNPSDGLAALRALRAQPAQKKAVLVFLAVFRESTAAQLIRDVLACGVPQAVAKNADGGVPAQNLLAKMKEAYGS